MPPRPDGLAPSYSTPARPSAPPPHAPRPSPLPTPLPFPTPLPSPRAPPLALHRCRFCAVGVSFRKECHVAGGGSSALWWLLLLLGLPLCCCCCCLTPEARAIWLKHLTGHPINTREAHTIYPVSESGEFKATAALSRSSVRYGAVTLSSRVRMALEELRSGQLRVDQVPARLAASPRSGMRHLPDEDEQELL